MRTQEGLEALAALIEAEFGAKQKQQYPSLGEEKVTIKQGTRWVKVDVGPSGKYMVDRDGSIYGIKGYGVPHLGHRYGTLDTTDQFDWSGYTAVRKPA